MAKLANIGYTTDGRIGAFWRNMRLLKVIRCLIKFKGHKYKYNVSLEGNAVIARKDCERCGYFKIKVDDGK